MEKWSRILSKFLMNSIKAIPSIPSVIANQTANVINDYKRKRSIACLVLLAAGAGGGATLSILEPAINDYVGGIAFAFLPVLNSSAENAAIGIIGALIGASVGFNLAKSFYRQYALQKNGHPNAALAFSASTATNIINANPGLFSNQPESISNVRSRNIESSEHEVVMDPVDENSENIESVLWILREVRSKMVKYKEDGTHRKRYLKHALLSAIRSYDLMPLQEMAVIDFWKREVRIKEFSRIMEASPEQIYSNLEKRVEELSNKDLIFSNRYFEDVSKPLDNAARFSLFGKMKCVVEKLMCQQNEELMLLPGNRATRERFSSDYLRNR